MSNSQQHSPEILIAVNSRPMIDGIANLAKQLGKWRLRFSQAKDPRIQALLDNPHLVGAIVTGHRNDIKRIHNHGIPCVNVMGESEADRYPTVLFDEHAIGALAAEHLMQLGLRQLIWCGTKHDFSRRREAGFRDYCEAHGGHVISKHWSWMSGTAENIGAWLERQDLPMGIGTCSDSMVDLVMAALTHVGIRVPDQAALVGVDNNELVCELSQQSISSVDRNEEGLGEAAIRLLAKIINGDKHNNDTIRVPPRFVVERRSSQMICLTDPDLRKAVEYIKSNATKPIDVHSLVQVTGLPRSSLFRKCRQHFQSSPAQLIRRQRLELARQLLLDTELNLTEIALRSGFPSASLLSRHFKAYYKQSPGAFRKL